MFSYVDTTTGFLFFNLDAEFSEEERAYISSQGTNWDVEHNTHVAFLSDHSTGLLFGKYWFKYLHEWCHMLEMVWFPYQYMHTWKELTIVRWLRQLLGKSEAEIPIGRIGLDAELMEVITYPAMVHPVRRTPQGVDFQGCEPDVSHPSPYDFTVLDLLENFTSIFEYKCRVQGPGDGHDYAKWLSDPSNKAYSNVFWFVADLWDVDFAYRLLPAVIQISFYTDWVFNAFTSLLTWLLEIKPVYENNTTDQLFYLLSNHMARRSTRHPVTGRFNLVVRDVSDFDLSPYLTAAFTRRLVSLDMAASEPNVVGTLESPTTHPTLLTTKFMTSFVSKTNRHPLQTYVSKYYELLQQDNSIETALFHPYDRNMLEFLRCNFAPLVMAVRLHDTSLKGRDTLLHLAPGFVDSPSAIDPNISYRWYLDEIMKRKDTAWSLVTRFNELLPHQCHHSVCPYFRTNLCRRWSAIPQTYWHCGFPNWFSCVYELRIDWGKMVLKPQEEEVGMNVRSLHIEGQPEVIEEFRKFVFDESPEVARALRPVHAMTPGFQREPLVIALVVALGGPVIVKELCGLVKRYFDLVSQREAQKHQIDVLRLLLEQDDRRKSSVSIAELEKRAEDPTYRWELTN